MKTFETISEMADYYYNHNPRLWDKSRLVDLVEAGRLTEKEYRSITGEPYRADEK